MTTAPGYCAIDFGTSNSAVAVPDGAAMRLIELEPGFRTMPTAVFYPGESDARGRAVDVTGHETRRGHNGRGAAGHVDPVVHDEGRA